MLRLSRLFVFPHLVPGSRETAGIKACCNVISCSQAAHEAISPDGGNGGGNKAESPLSLALKASAETK